MWDAHLDDDAYRQIPDLTGTSHAVILEPRTSTAGRQRVGLRFFTSTEELPACGHGTVAAVAFLAQCSTGHNYRTTIQTQTRSFTARAVKPAAAVALVEFDPGPIHLRPAIRAERELASKALSSAAKVELSECFVATVGRPRLLVPLPSTEALWQLAPDPALLREACDRLGLLGCYAYTTPSANGRVTARMFAPAIGVTEDIANANSAACLAALLAEGGTFQLQAEMGDAVGRPATILASARGNRCRVGGLASVSDQFELPPDLSAR